MPRLQIKDEEARRYFQREASEGLRARRSRALQRAGLFLEGEMKRAAPVKTGTLRRSIASKMIGDDRVEVGVIRSQNGRELVYAATQEFGGTISGRPWLAIPINYSGNPVLTKARVGGIRARDVRANPRQFGFVDTFVRNGVVFGVKEGAKSSRRGRRGTIAPKLNAGGIVALFALRRSVTIEGREYIYGTYAKHEARVVQFIRDAMVGGEAA